jgi:SAM-dependent MidA family methyltransferase
VPDGSCDLTAHVALDACAAAARADATLFTTQRDALRQLGIAGTRPPRELASDDPAGYLRRLAAASEDGELLDPAGLGGFSWLVQVKGVPLPLS